MRTGPVTILKIRAKTGFTAGSVHPDRLPSVTKPPAVPGKPVFLRSREKTAHAQPRI